MRIRLREEDPRPRIDLIRSRGGARVKPTARACPLWGGGAPHAPIPDEHALRAALAHPPTLGCSFSGGCAPTPPAGVAGEASPPRAVRPPLPGGERAGVRGSPNSRGTRPAPGKPVRPFCPRGRGRGELRSRRRAQVAKASALPVGWSRPVGEHEKGGLYGAARADRKGRGVVSAWSHNTTGGQAEMTPAATPPHVARNEAGRPCGRPVVCVAPSRAARCRAGRRRARGGGPCRPTPAPHASGGGSRAGSCSPS